MSMTATDNRPFSPRALFALIGVGAIAFAAMAYFMISADGRGTGGGLVSASAGSRSAIGYHAFVELMKHADISVVQSRPPGVGARVSLHVLLAPSSPQDVRDSLKWSTVKTLIVLPKWRGYTRPSSDHLVGVSPVDLGTVRSMARAVADDIEIVRPTEAVPWRNDVLLHGQPTLGHPQLMRSPKLCPVLASGKDMLIAQVCQKPWLFVLSDPDLISNHGLWRGDNAVLAINAVKWLLGNSLGSVLVFDEPVRHAPPPAPSIWRLAFEPPFVLITCAALAAIAIAAWLAAMRFGPPAREVPDRLPGVRTLIDVGARLLSARGGQRLLRRYAEGTLLDLGRRLHAPRGLSGANEIGGWLDASGRGAVGNLNYRALAQRIDSASPAEVVARAAELHRWREELLNGR